VGWVVDFESGSEFDGVFGEELNGRSDPAGKLITKKRYQKTRHVILSGTPVPGLSKAAYSSEGG
jgi:hypothetical protein